MPQSTPVFADGFGRRVLRVASAEAAPTEHLVLNPVLAGHAGFMAALKDRVAQLQGKRLTSYVRVQAFDVEADGGPEIVSEYVRGWRLADLLDVAESENLTFDIGVVMLLLRQLLPSAALLSSLAAVPLRTLGASAGVIAEALGWSNFFILTTLAALPAMIIMVWLLRRVPPPAAEEKPA